MNSAKRKILTACADIIKVILTEEKADLAATPDNIEDSRACDIFRASIAYLNDAHRATTRAVNTR